MDDLVGVFKGSLVEEGMKEREAKCQWELRSSRGYKFRGDQRVSNIFKFKSKPEVDVNMSKRE